METPAAWPANLRKYGMGNPRTASIPRIVVMYREVQMDYIPCGVEPLPRQRCEKHACLVFVARIGEQLSLLEGDGARLMTNARDERRDRVGFCCVTHVAYRQDLIIVYRLECTARLGSVEFDDAVGQAFTPDGLAQL